MRGIVYVSGHPCDLPPPRSPRPPRTDRERQENRERTYRVHDVCIRIQVDCPDRSASVNSSRDGGLLDSSLALVSGTNRRYHDLFLCLDIAIRVYIPD